VPRISLTTEALPPETARLLEAWEPEVHEAVRMVTVHGSRGPAGGAREDSDLDVCLVTDIDGVTDPEPLLKEVLATTLGGETCPVTLDAAAVFDARWCGLGCFERDAYAEGVCPQETVGCLGIYKTETGFEGFMPPSIDIKRMYPFAVVWRKEGTAPGGEEA
jgi:hypothetical protein